MCVSKTGPLPLARELEHKTLSTKTCISLRRQHDRQWATDWPWIPIYL